MKRDAEAVKLALQWFEEHNPFDGDRDKKVLVSFSTGFTSTGNDAVNAERAAEVGRNMQKKLDGQPATSTMEVKSKVQALSSLRYIPKINEKKIHIDSLKYFNRLIIFAQRDMTVETSLEYELTPVPLSLFSNKDQKMNKPSKAVFAKSSLMKLTAPHRNQPPCSFLVVDGGWLLYTVKWEAGQTWQEIANSYGEHLQHLGSQSQKIIVAFDGFNISPKDHDRIRNTTKACCDMQIQPDMIHLAPRARFLDNVNNKRALIQLLASAFRDLHITVVQSDSDADTIIVREALAAAMNGSVEVNNICMYFLHSSQVEPITDLNSKSFDHCKIYSIFRCRQKR